MNEPIVKRHPGNPILTPADIPYAVQTVHNAGVVKHEGGYIMLFRAHRDNGRSILGLAESSDGYRFTPRREPFLVPARDGVFGEYEAYGVEDPPTSILWIGSSARSSASLASGYPSAMANSRCWTSSEKP